MIFMFSYLGFDGVVVWMARKCGQKKKWRKWNFVPSPCFFGSTMERIIFKIRIYVIYFPFPCFSWEPNCGCVWPAPVVSYDPISLVNFIGLVRNYRRVFVGLSCVTEKMKGRKNITSLYICTRSFGFSLVRNQRNINLWNFCFFEPFFSAAGRQFANSIIIGFYNHGKTSMKSPSSGEIWMLNDS